jgi:hypothetical protein
MLELVLIPFGFATDVAAILITRRHITSVCKFGSRICMQMRLAKLKYVLLGVFGLFHCIGFIVRQSSLWQIFVYLVSNAQSDAPMVQNVSEYGRRKN